MMYDWFGTKMPSQLKETLPQVAGHEPLDHGLLQQSPLLLHASRGISQQQTYGNHKQINYQISHASSAKQFVNENSQTTIHYNEMLLSHNLKIHTLNSTVS